MRVIYLNNRDLLREIHKSKKTYCTYKDPTKDTDFDLILRDIKNDPKPFWEKLEDFHSIGPAQVAQAKLNRAERLTKLAGKDSIPVDPESFKDTDVVFRVMTFAHVPMAPPKVPKSKAKTKILVEEIDSEDFEDDDIPLELVTIDPLHVKVNFPPFHHYRLGRTGKLKLIAKSHWTGDLKDGHFSKDHGAMTRELANMFMKLCERYATRSNWRGYTYNDEMRSQALLQLSQIGLQFDECKSQNPFAYYTAAITNSFTRILNIEKRNQNIRDDILEMNNYTPSYTRQMDWGGGGGHGPDE